tara:strand:+ start:1075 stop:1869 length:795 start_codon:yes stop_codon:yes gene_type:complete
MKLTDKILKTLREGTVGSSMGQDDTTKVVAKSNNLTKTLKDVEASKAQGGGDVEVEVIDEALNEVVDGSAVVQFDSDRSGEEPFMMSGIKWQFVNGIYPDGKKDIAVYRFDHDLAYDYKWFRDTFIDKTNGNKRTNEDLGDDYESISRGSDMGEVGADDYEEMERLKQSSALDQYVVSYWKYTRDGDDFDIFHNEVEASSPEEAIEMTKKRDPRGRRFYINLINGKKIVESVAKMSKGDLEKLIESKVTPKKRIIKVGDLKKKK